MGNAKQVVQEHVKTVAELLVKVLVMLHVKVAVVQLAEELVEEQENNGAITSFYKPYCY